MKTTTFVLACSLLGLALVAVPFDSVSVAPTAAAVQCPVSDDPVRDLECQTRCMSKDPKEILEPRMCPA
jgi:hypothetical protein